MQENEIPPLGGYSDKELDKAFAEVAREVEKSAAALRSADDKEQFRLAWLGRKQGRLKAISDAWLKSAPPTPRSSSASASTRSKPRSSSAWNRPGRGSTAEALDAEAIDITLPGTRRKPGVEHPLMKTMERDRRGLPAHGLLGRRGARGRDRLLQLRVAELPARPSRARYPGHAGPRRPGAQAIARPPADAHPHLARADSHHGAAAAADPHRHPRQGAPQRRRRRDALAGLPPGGRPVRRHQHHLLRPEGNARLTP